MSGRLSAVSCVRPKTEGAVGALSSLWLVCVLLVGFISTFQYTVYFLAYRNYLGSMAHTCNPCTREAEAGR